MYSKRSTPSGYGESRPWRIGSMDLPIWRTKSTNDIEDSTHSEDSQSLRMKSVDFLLGRKGSGNVDFMGDNHRKPMPPSMFATFDEKKMLHDDVLATLIKLRHAASSGAQSDRWETLEEDNRLSIFRMRSDWNLDADISDALAGHMIFDAHLNEVLSVFITHDGAELSSTMKALYGNRFKRGDVLLPQCDASSFVKDDSFDNDAPSKKAKGYDVAMDGQLGVQLEVMRPKGMTDLHKHKNTQNLVFQTYTRKSTNGNRAYHLKKTLPKQLQNKLVDPKHRSALRDGIDHIGLGYHMKKVDEGEIVGLGKKTRVFVHAYVSPTSPDKFLRSGYNLRNGSNPEAYFVMYKMVKSLNNIDRIIRRRRLGYQTYVSQYPGRKSRLIRGADCNRCYKSFNIFNKDYFCQLCGKVVCSDCSGQYEVEPSFGVVTKRRLCTLCVVRVDACYFDDDLVYLGLGPDIVPSKDDDWDTVSNYSTDTEETVCSDRSLSGNFSEVWSPLRRSEEELPAFSLDLLDSLVAPMSNDKAMESPKENTERVRANIEQYLDNSLHHARKYLSIKDCEVASKERDYTLEYEDGKTFFKDHPVAPKMDEKKDALRIKHLESCGFFKEKHDRQALDMIAELAAKRMDCGYASVSILDRTTFYSVGTYRYPESGLILPRDDSICSHSLYAEKPFIIPDLGRDVRFSHTLLVQKLNYRFYASFPVYAPDGSVAAGICVVNEAAKGPMTTKQYATMRAVCNLASQFLFSQAKA